MTSEPEGAQPPFKDYYLILQLHPEADAAMVDAAYWHLARRYNQACVDDPSATAKLDDLNEAYTVLGSAERREAYNRARSAVLGAGVLPSPAPPEPEPAPLAVLEKQRPRPPADATPQRAKRFRPNFRQVSVPPWQNVANALVLVTLASAALLAWAHPALVGALALIGVVLVMLPLVRKLPRPSMPRPGRRTIGGADLDEQGRAGAAPDSQSLRRSTEAILARWRATAPATAPHTPRPPDSPDEFLKAVRDQGREL